MKQIELLNRLIDTLVEERPQYRKYAYAESIEKKKQLLRGLMNIRPPQPIDEGFLQMQDSYLQNELEAKGIVHISQLEEIKPHIALWQGDITRLDADAIVNAANSAMLGCFIPCHGCIDNAIHSAAGVQLRLACHKLMEHQNYEEPTGSAKITSAFNLPSRYVLHTVGPIIQGKPTTAQCKELAACYRACFMLAEQYQLTSITYCCISTGEFHFPNRLAAEIAVETIGNLLKGAIHVKKVIFNVFKEGDYAIYSDLLTKNDSLAPSTFIS